MSAMPSGPPTSDTSQHLQGSGISTQPAISAGQNSYPVDALGAYIISLDPWLVCQHQPQLWKKSSSVIHAPVLFSASPFTSLFLRQLALCRAVTGVSRSQPYCSSLQPLWAWGWEFTRAMQAVVSRTVRVYSLKDIQSIQPQVFWSLLSLCELLLWQRQAVPPAQHSPQFSECEMCSK